MPPGHEEVNSINIYKDNVVYQVWGKKWDVWLLNIKSGNKRQISANHSWHEMLPRIWGDSVVWEDWRNGYGLGDIYLYNLKTKETRQITSYGMISVTATGTYTYTTWTKGKNAG